MIIAALVVVLVVLVGLVLALSFRDRGRDRSAWDVPQREDRDVAGSNGATRAHHQQLGPGA